MKVNPDSCRNKQTDTTYEDRFNSIQTEASLIKQGSYIRQGRYIHADAGTARLNWGNQNWCRHIQADTGICRLMQVYPDRCQCIKTEACISRLSLAYTDSIHTDTDRFGHNQTDEGKSIQKPVYPVEVYLDWWSHIQTNSILYRQAQGISGPMQIYPDRC
jgi:hypothetical protein